MKTMDAERKKTAEKPYRAGDYYGGRNGNKDASGDV